MGASPENNAGSSESQPLDLSELQSLSFGPSWTERKSSEAPKHRDRPSRDNRGGPAKDRRRGGRPERKPEAGSPRERGNAPDRGGDRRPPRRDFRGDRQGPPREDFKPIVDVTFYPEDIPFKALSHAMKTSCRTYELFEIAKLILQKPERFVVVLHPLKSAGEGKPQEFFQSVPDGIPFQTEDAAITHVLKEYAEKFFTVEEVEVEAPKGNFMSVGKCGVTGELLGPPNYHRYQSLLQEHHASKVPNMPFEKFAAKVEQIKDPEVVNEWMTKMTKLNRYSLIDRKEGEPENLDGLEAARLFLLSRRREAVVRKVDHVRFSGTGIDKLPKGDLRRSVESVLELQQRFPLETANNLRGRLRRMRFTIYKKGSKGVSYVCAVKRNFREPDTKLSDSVQSVIEFIEQNPGVSLGELPDKYLGIKPEEQISAEKEKAPDIEEVPREQAEAIVEEHEIRRQERLAQQAGETSAEDTSAAAEEPVAAAPEAKVEETKAVEPERASAIEDPRIKQLMIDLHWLVHEGYVIELGDGKLFAVPYLQGSKHPDTDDSDDSEGGEVETEPTEEPVAEIEPEEVSSAESKPQA